MNEQNNNQENNDYTFLREKIKERPVNRRKIFRQSLLTIALAITFALFACFIFFFFERGTIAGFSKEQEAEKVELKLQETTDEILPEDMIKEDVVEVEPPVETPDNTAIIADAIAAYEPDIDDYQGIFNKMKALASEANKCLVTVISIQDKTTWLNSAYENKTRTTGVIVEDNGVDLLVLADADILTNSNEIVISFFNTQECTASVKSIDPYTNLCILTVPLSELHDTTKSAISYALWANSTLSCKPGDVVIAVGDPLGYGSSIGYGILTSTGTEINGVDHNYTLLTTDIYGSEDATGILINKSGKIVGIINQTHNKRENQNLISAIGTTELTSLIEDLCNGISRPHMGVEITNVSSIAMHYYNVPIGAYITNIQMDSPAMNSGLHKGDVITAINDAIITGVLDYELELNDYKPDDTIVVTVLRPNGDTYIDMDIKVTLSE